MSDKIESVEINEVVAVETVVFDSKDLLELQEISKSRAGVVINSFKGFVTRLNDIEPEFNELVLKASNSEMTEELYDEILTTSKAIAKVRTTSEANRKKVKRQSLVEGRCIDSVNKIVELAAKEKEDKFKELIEPFERRKEIALEELEEKRYCELSKYYDKAQFLTLNLMSQEEFNELVSVKKEIFEQVQAVKEAERKALEDEKIQALKVEKELADLREEQLLNSIKQRKELQESEKKRKDDIEILRLQNKEKQDKLQEEKNEILAELEAFRKEKRDKEQAIKDAEQKVIDDAKAEEDKKEAEKKRVEKEDQNAIEVKLQIEEKHVYDLTVNIINDLIKDCAELPLKSKKYKSKMANIISSLERIEL